MFDSCVRQIKGAKRIVFITGAGISQESGIPTYRGDDGLWRNYNPMELATINAFNRDPNLVWKWYDDRRKNILAAEPNPGHKAIAELEKFAEVTILTQNIDGLHQRAGSSCVLELHGSIIRVRCTVCDFIDVVEKNFDVLPPMCKCGNMLRPDVVWFGESLPGDVWSKALDYASHAELMIIAGTSLTVSPANALPIHTKENGGMLVEINPDTTEMSYVMDLSVRQTSSVALPELVKIFES